MKVQQTRFVQQSSTKSSSNSGRSPSRRFLRRRGVMAVICAVVVIVFIIAAVFSVDTAYMQLTRTKLRTATDAAARAAGEALSRAQDLDAARQAAKDIAAANLVAGEPLILEDEDIIFGEAARSTEGVWSFTPGSVRINAVRVNGRRTADSSSGSVRLFLAGILGVDAFEPTQTATVVRLDRDICLVVDRSSSMKLFLTDTAPTMSTSDPRFCQPPNSTISRWSALSAAIDEFISHLGNTPQIEHVGLVSYASAGSWCGDPNTDADINQQLNGNHTLTQNAVQGISNSTFNGATNISAGIDAGVVVLTSSSARPYAAKTMVLFTDGHANRGRPVVDAAEDADAENIVIHTITFGDGANQADMQAVAEATSGNYYHAPDAAALQEIFREIAYTLPVVTTE